MASNPGQASAAAPVRRDATVVVIGGGSAAGYFASALLSELGTQIAAAPSKISYFVESASIVCRKCLNRMPLAGAEAAAQQVGVKRHGCGVLGFRLEF